MSEFRKDKNEWTEMAIKHSIHTEVQTDGRIKHWARIEEVDKYLRVILLSDGQVVHNAFFDRTFKFPRRNKMKLSKLENQALIELSRVFREQFGAKEVRLYGSAARDEMDEDSDIDIFLVLPEINWQIEKDIIKLCFDAELRYGRVFSAVCYSVDDIQNSPLKESPLVLNVRKQGRLL